MTTKIAMTAKMAINDDSTAFPSLDNSCKRLTLPSPAVSIPICILLLATTIANFKTYAADFVFHLPQRLSFPNYITTIEMTTAAKSTALLHAAAIILVLVLVATAALFHKQTSFSDLAKNSRGKSDVCLHLYLPSTNQSLLLKTRHRYSRSICCLVCNLSSQRVRLRQVLSVVFLHAAQVSSHPPVTATRGRGGHLLGRAAQDVLERGLELVCQLKVVERPGSQRAQELVERGRH
mmetsp:Transcript_217/g.379  ORF Transcript_217/g.379 Transcript_217/m.379 type:complete len:235 (-) Transcript_217:710-1414(-)